MSTSLKRRAMVMSGGSRSGRRWRSTGIAAVVLAVGAAALGGCGSSNDGASGDDAAGGASSSASGLDGGGKELVYFTLPTSVPVVKDNVAAAKAEATKLGYQLTVIESSFDPAEQNQKAQQALSSGRRPAAFMWYPADSKAGINTTRRLSTVAPVFQTDGILLPEGEPYVEAYAGVDAHALGMREGELLMAARGDARKSGMELHSENGNLLYINFPKALITAQYISDGVAEAVKSEPFSNVWEEPGGVDAQSGYDIASQAIPKYRDRGIDFILTGNSDVASGVMKAVRENGLTPGEDVIVVAGNLAAPCSEQVKQIEDGKLAGAVYMSPEIAGRMVVRAAAQYLAANEVTPGVERLEPTTETPSAEATPPHQYTYMPLPKVTSAEGLDTKLWGVSPREFCGG